jgi:hypothetical protein
MWNTTPLLSLAAVLPLALLPACQETGGQTEEASPDAGRSQPEELVAWMTGWFSSAEQAALLPDDYFDIRLFMVPIWTDRTDGPWLYVEQAAASALQRPYRQRVYHLVATEDGVRSDVYELPGDPLVFAGDWRTPERFVALGPDELVPRTGCSIFLERTADGYRGSTVEGDCPSTLAGASYATSEVVISEDVLESWDRGFDAHGEQVWGATAGAYVFVKIEAP